jgi:predicted ribosomally synthesized peptide with SipW-like signal peptide
MKQILASAMIIAALGALVVSSTLALFTDQAVIAGNTVATNSFDLTLNHSEGKPYHIEHAYPGYVDGWEYIDIYNTGDHPFKAHITFEQTGGDVVLYNALKVKMVSAGGDGICNTGSFGEFVIYDGFIKDFPNQKLVSTSEYWHLATGVPAHYIQPGYTQRICQQLSIDPNAGNEIMGTSVVFSEIVDATQNNNLAE